MKVYYSCVLDVNPKFQYQCWIWVHSLLELAQVSPSHIWVHYIKGVDQIFLNRLRELTVQLKEIEPFADGVYCNKIAQLSNPSLEEVDAVVLMDTDTFVMRNFVDDIDLSRVNGKIVDLPNPDINVLDKVFARAGLVNTIGVTNTDFSGEMTYQGNFNGGLYVIPRIFIKPLNDSWRKWALWLLETGDLHSVGKGNHVDQVSFCMALHENQIPLVHLDRQYNYPIHLSFYKDITPTVIHYHWELQTDGLLVSDSNSSLEYQDSIRHANKVIQKRFDNLTFWNYRYSVHPELGSGIGSRDDNLEIKKDFLKRLKIEEHSVLDIGCGDLHVMRDFQIKSYIGVDSSEKALSIAAAKRSDWSFYRAGSRFIDDIEPQDYVTCFDVLIHQKNEHDFNEILDLLFRKTKMRLLVSGYSVKKKHHDTNHMLSFHQSLYESLQRSHKFESVIRLFQINDSDYYACDVTFDVQFWENIFRELLINKVPYLVGKQVVLHVGSPKAGASSLQKFLFENRDVLKKRGFLYPETVEGYRHQSLVNATLRNDWLSFVHFFECIHSEMNATGTLLISSEDFYSHALHFNKIGLLFWKVLSDLTDLKIVVSDDRAKDLHYEKNVEVWSNIAGANNVIIRPYQSDTIEDFLQLVKIEEQVLYEIQRQKESLVALRNKGLKKLISQIKDYYVIKSSGLFERDFYLSRYGDIRENKKDPILHYVRHGLYEFRDPSIAFNTKYYLENYPDVAQSGVNPFVHYIRYGRSEGRITSRGEG